MKPMSLSHRYSEPILVMAQFLCSRFSARKNGALKSFMKSEDKWPLMWRSWIVNHRSLAWVSYFTVIQCDLEHRKNDDLTMPNSLWQMRATGIDERCRLLGPDSGTGIHHEKEIEYSIRSLKRTYIASYSIMCLVLFCLCHLLYSVKISSAYTFFRTVPPYNLH